MINTREVQVVLATYNGVMYLEAQIVSILDQLGEGQLLVHDDGSSDGTLELLEWWAERDGRVKILPGPPQGGASANFSYLLRYTTAPYVFCADQDDIWKPDKLITLLKVMKFYEGIYGEETPLLVHSDLSLIDKSGQLIAESMWTYQNLDPRWGNHFNLLLTQNVITGCAMLVNRTLLHRGLPIPPDASMHDHWLALVACGQGKVIYIDKPMTLYRQHGNNVVGAYRYNPYSSIIKLKRLLIGKENLREGNANKQPYSNAKRYVERFAGRREVVIAQKFLNLQSCPMLIRPFIIMRNRFLFCSLTENLIWAIRPANVLMRLGVYLSKWKK